MNYYCGHVNKFKVKFIYTVILLITDVSHVYANLNMH